MAALSGPEDDLLKIGRAELAQLRQITDPDELAIQLRAAAEDPEARPGMVAALFAAVVDGHAAARGSGAAALGVAAGLTGHSSDLYRAARLSSDVHAVERSIETGDPRYVERRVKNKIIGRALGRAGVWRRLWR